MPRSDYKKTPPCREKTGAEMRKLTSFGTGLVALLRMNLVHPSDDDVDAREERRLARRAVRVESQNLVEIARVGLQIWIDQLHFASTWSVQGDVDGRCFDIYFEQHTANQWFNNYRCSGSAVSRLLLRMTLFRDTCCQSIIWLLSRWEI